MYLGAQEINPLIAGLVKTDIPAFVILKLTVSIGVGVIFIIAQKILMKTADKNSKSFKIVLKTIKIAYFSIAIFLTVVVINNILTLIQFL